MKSEGEKPKEEKEIVLCSPSKVDDFAKYFMYYPMRPLKIDLLVDLLLYPQLLLSEVAYTSLFSIRDIEDHQWKHAFEDLVNMKVIRLAADYPSENEELELIYMADRNQIANEPVMDLAVLAMHSQKREMPLVFRDQDVQLLDPATDIIQMIKGGKRQIDRDENLERELQSQIAVWFIEMRLPRLFARQEPEDMIKQPQEEIKEFAFIDPNDLVYLMKDQTALSQLREHIRRLAMSDPSKAQVRDFIKLERVARNKKQKKFKFAEIVFEAVDFGLIMVPPPISTIANLVAKAMKKFTFHSLSHPYRWLLFTEKIDAQLVDRESEMEANTNEGIES